MHMVKFVEGRPVVASAREARQYTDDPRRAHQVVVTVPIAIATLLKMTRGKHPQMSTEDALVQVFTEQPGLRAAFRQDGGGHVPGATGNEVADALATSARGHVMVDQEPSATAQILKLAQAEIQRDATLSRAAALGRVAKREPVLYNRAARENTAGQDYRLSTTNDAGAAADWFHWGVETTPAAPSKVHIEKVKPVSTAEAAVSAALKIINGAADGIMATQPGMSRGAAITQALKQNPSYYDEYVAALKRQAKGLPAGSQDDES